MSKKRAARRSQHVPRPDQFPARVSQRHPGRCACSCATLRIRRCCRPPPADRRARDDVRDQGGARVARLRALGRATSSSSTTRATAPRCATARRRTDGRARRDHLPYDLDWDDPFTDDDLHVPVTGVPSDARLTVILDCCHAGTGLRDVATRECLQPPAATPLQSNRRRRVGPTLSDDGGRGRRHPRRRVPRRAGVGRRLHRWRLPRRAHLLPLPCGRRGGFVVTYEDVLRRLRGRLRATASIRCHSSRDRARRRSLPVFAGAARRRPSSRREYESCTRGGKPGMTADRRDEP